MGDYRTAASLIALSLQRCATASVDEGGARMRVSDMCKLATMHWRYRILPPGTPGDNFRDAALAVLSQAEQLIDEMMGDGSEPSPLVRVEQRHSRASNPAVLSRSNSSRRAVTMGREQAHDRALQVRKGVAATMLEGSRSRRDVRIIDS